MIAILLGLALQAPGDTVRLPARDALDRAVAASGPLRAATARARGAQAAVRTAGTWANPLFNVTAENLGAEREVTGKPPIAGIEGQVTLQQPLTLGGDRGARVRQARANADAASAGAELAEADTRVAAVTAIALAERDQRHARHAVDEAAALAEFARIMTRRADEGRTAGGDAARARLEAVTATSLASRRLAQAEQSNAELARVLGLEPGTPVRVALPACAAPIAPGADSVAVPELRQVMAEADAARAAADLAGAQRVPDLLPIAGLRRTAGYSGLLLGLSVELPLLRSGAAAQETARAHAEALEATRAATERRVAAERVALEAATARLDGARGAYEPALLQDLERAVRAAESRLAQGEATLVELLDARRARIALLNEFDEWRTARLELRARRARLAGLPLDERVLCEDLDLEPR